MPEKKFSLPGFHSAFWPAAGILICWLVLISQVRHHWGGESYYNFGWFVPFLAIWLFLRNLSDLEASPQPHLKLQVILTIFAALVTVPFHALSEVNPFWRLPLWIQAFWLCIISFAAIHSVYGWKGIKASIFPLFFLCTMIPWPYRFEVWIVQSLTGVVSGIAVDGLNFLGYPVQLAGNSIVLGDLSIGVNEACSGIRSLQALFMVTLFLGSLFAQSTWRRIAAILLLPLVVIVVNAARAIFLSTQVIVNGQQSYEAWHDPAGYIAFGVSMLLIYACIEILNTGSQGERQSQNIDGNLILQQLKTSRLSAACTVFVAAPVLLYAIVEGWFQVHEMFEPERRGWEMLAPSNDPNYRSLEIHSEVSTLLGYSHGERFVLGLGRDQGVEVYYYTYGEEDKLASVSSYGHSPAICMESIGATMLEQFSDLIVEVNGLEIPVHHFLFQGRSNEYLLNVFWVVWEHRNMDIDPEELSDLNYKTQWIQLVKGRRDFSRQVLLTNVIGADNPTEAREITRNLFKDWIQPVSD